MVKVITSIRRKPGMAVDEFQRYWREQHPAVVTALPGIRRYVQSHVLPTGYRKGDPPWDGIAEVWADDTDALRAMTRSAANLAVQADEARFIDRASMGLIVTEEHTVLDGPAGPEAVKGIEFLSRRPDLSVEAFQEHWRTRHASILAKIPGLTRCVLSLTRRSAYTAGRAPIYDGVTLMWFASPEALRGAAASTSYADAVADRPAFLASSMPPFIVTHEHVIVG
ncbi:MAG TPA: EthD domain-containing protein [Methylomirabilota bacterium]|jgi:uncharacterized protein (TIGR02118 family)|nr:EthD domain-containing protein [Methylomirabilota bacterium]